MKVPDTGNDTVKVLTHVTSTYPITPGTLALVTLPIHGTATVDAAHVVKYAPRTIGSELTHDSFTYDVKDTDGQLSNKGTVGVTIFPVPVIASISRTSGPTTGGTQVTITGTGFSTVSSVKFGTTPATGITVRSETQLVAIAPAHAAGTVGISVTTPGGTSATTPADLYKFVVPPPVVSAISPSSGPAAGSTTVTVSGSGLSGASKVYFGTKTRDDNLGQRRREPAHRQEPVGHIGIVRRRPGGDPRWWRATRCRRTCSPTARSSRPSRPQVGRRPEAAR